MVCSWELFGVYASNTTHRDRQLLQWLLELLLHLGATLLLRHNRRRDWTQPWDHQLLSKVCRADLSLESCRSDLSERLPMLVAPVAVATTHRIADRHAT